ncbi:hypothetical protein [Leadbetterella sp. DM7]|uniref:hypothetical protein n=1 Tax=Leadbetterella sp. DM7 TaxID=3235085 RepID=UPI00349E5225
MTVTEAITLVISSSVLSAILTGLVSLRIQSLNYKQEYYKKIIERRIYAQEEILNLSNELSIQVKLDNGALCNRICATGEDHFNSIVILVGTSVNVSFWLSKKLSDILLELNIFLLNEISHNIKGKSQEERDLSLISLGIQNHEKIREYRKSIESQLMKDFGNAFDVKSFIRSNYTYEDKLYWLKK